MKKLKLFTETLALVGLLTLLTLLVVAPGYWWIGTLLMLPNTIYQLTTTFKNNNQQILND